MHRRQPLQFHQIGLLAGGPVMLRSLFYGCVLLVLASRYVEAQVTSVTPRSCTPGQTTLVTLTGKGLDPSLQLALRLPGASIELRSVEPTQATAAVALPDDAPLGPFGLWISRATGPQEPLAMLVDRL